MINFSDPEGYIDSSEDLPLPDGTLLQCTYTVTVYTGYGVELQACFKKYPDLLFSAAGFISCLSFILCFIRNLL